MPKKSKKGSSKEIIELAIVIVIIVGGVLGADVALQAALGTPDPIVVVTSSSMVPTLNIGDVCVIQRVSTNQYVVGNHNNRTGDIIVYDATGIYPGSEPVIHRIVDKKFDPGTNHTWFLTWGDNNYVPDNDSPYVHGSFPNGWVEDTRIFGKVIATIPWIGNIFLFIRGGGVWLLVLLLAVVIIYIFVDEASKIQKKAKEKLESNSSVHSWPISTL